VCFAAPARLGRGHKRNTRNQTPGRRSQRETHRIHDGAIEIAESAMQRRIYELTPKETRAVVGGARMPEPSAYRIRYAAPPVAAV
jgi:hypothetical protein